MILAIVPVPNRNRSYGGVCRGMTTESTWGEPSSSSMIQTSHTPGIQTYGRDIYDRGFQFYKVYSVWNNHLIEHTFLTDESINHNNWYIHLNRTGGVENTPPVLVPIAVKHHTAVGSTVSPTFLFTKNIDNLLRVYDGSPIRYLDYTNHTPASSPMRIPVHSYDGVCGIASYFEQLFHCINCVDIRTDIRCWEPPNAQYRLKEKLTPEVPCDVLNTLRECAYYEVSPDAFYDFANDVLGESTNSNPPFKFINDYLYYDAVDPITSMCLATPSFITLDMLKPLVLVDGYNSLDTWYRIATTEVGNSADIDYKDLRSFVDMFADDYGVEDIVEYFYNAAGTDISIIISKQQEHPVINIQDRFGVSSTLNDSATFLVTTSLRQLFLNCRSAQVVYDTVSIYKTWLGELFVDAYSLSYPRQLFHLNMSMYHLVTPSLINNERLHALNFLV